MVAFAQPQIPSPPPAPIGVVKVLSDVAATGELGVQIWADGTLRVSVRLSPGGEPEVIVFDEGGNVVLTHNIPSPKGT